MPGAYTERPEQDKRSGTRHNYLWFIKDIDIVREPMRLQHILSSVFANLAMKCVTAGEQIAGSRMTSWLANLREVSNLHFDTSPEALTVMHIGEDWK